MMSLKRKTKKFFLPCLCLIAFFVMTFVLSRRDAITNLTNEMLHIANANNVHAGVRNSIPQFFYQLSVDHPELVEAVRTSVFQTPSKKPYNLTHDVSDYSRGQSKVIDKKNGGKKNGYFVDVGAGNGEKGSVSLFFERTRGWTGLLVEPAKDLFTELRHKNRNATIANTCVRSDIMDVSKNGQYFVDEHSGKTTDVPCFWMSTILLATKQNHIDILSIDIQGKEIEILKSVPFKHIRIEFIAVELSMDLRDDYHLSLIAYVQDHGYTPVIEFVNHVEHARDIVFQHN